MFSFPDQEILYQEEQGYVGLYYERLLGYVMTVHLHQWSPSEYKRYLFIWNHILQGLRDREIDVVYGLCIDEHRQKFTELFGFTFSGNQLLCQDGITRNVMVLEL